MEPVQHQNAWLERAGTGEKVPIHGSCFFGRHATSTVLLPSEKVSRRHAMIQTQGIEFWLIDLGSANGTYLNGRRVMQPCRVADNDQIMIADFQFLFRTHNTVLQQRATEGAAPEGRTIQDIRSGVCWLLVADIIAATQMGQRLSPEDASRVVGRWLLECKQMVEEHSGVINKFLGDGFFAYWMDGTGTGARSILKAVNSFKALQQKQEPPFRVVLHYGKVFMGGGGSMGEESFVGQEVNFVFRMEKVAGKLGRTFLVSEAAATLLRKETSLSEEGTSPVPSFEGEFKFFGI